MDDNVQEAFWERVYRSQGCWLWAGPVNRDSYDFEQGD